MNGLRSMVVMWAAAVTTVSAQGLSSPMGEQPSGQKAPAPVPHLQGQGPGVHSPLSSFAPIKPREDVVHWSVLTDIKTELRNRRIVPVYTPAIQALNGKTQRVQGFMLPLGAGEQQRHFLLVSIPPSCPFCTPGGPESMVEIRTRAPVKYSLDIVVVEGRFHVLQNDPYGLYYRMTEAVGVK